MKIFDLELVCMAISLINHKIIKKNFLLNNFEIKSWYLNYVTGNENDLLKNRKKFIGKSF